MTIGRTHLHEAAHCLVSLVIGDGVPLAMSAMPALNSRGFVLPNRAGEVSTFAEIVFLAAGDASEFFPGLEVGGDALPIPSRLSNEMRDIDITAGAVVRDIGECRTRGTIALRSDWENIEIILAEAVERGDCKPRERMVHRYWQRARERGRRILDCYREELYGLAAALARNHGLLNADIRAVLDGMNSPLTRFKSNAAAAILEAA